MVNQSTVFFFEKAMSPWHVKEQNSKRESTNFHAKINLGKHENRV